MATDGVTRAPLLGEPLAVEFMNTIWADRSGVHDALATTADVASWLRSSPSIPGVADEVQRGWPSAVTAPVAEETTAGLCELRDAVRRLAATQTGDPREPAGSAVERLDVAVDIINRAAAAAPHWSRLAWSDDTGPRDDVATGAHAGATITAGVAEQAIELFAGDQRRALRACMAPGCVLYFIKQHPRREWCSIACGNRARAARHYRRHRAVDAAD